MNEPLISIIVPVYNAEEYLSKCVDSILGQSYKNLEIILVDDGSSDSSPKLCDQYKIKDSRVLVIHQTNQGVSVARNIGINIAKGDYIAFVDSDDYILPKMYELLLLSIQKYNVSISFCDIFFEKNNKRYTLPNQLEGTLISWKNAIKEAFLDRGSFTYFVNKLFKRDLFLNNNIFFNPQKVLSEDADIIYKLYYYAQNLAYVEEPLYIYVQHLSSTIYSLSVEKRICSLDIAEKALEFDLEYEVGARKEILIWNAQQLYGLLMLTITSKSHNKAIFFMLRKKFMGIIEKEPEVEKFLINRLGKYKVGFVKYCTWSFLGARLLYFIYKSVFK